MRVYRDEPSRAVSVEEMEDLACIRSVLDGEGTDAIVKTGTKLMRVDDILYFPIPATGHPAVILETKEMFR